MKNDIILAGVGGQGIISIAAVIGYAAVKLGLFLKQSEVHGMSQRGGEVQSHLRISDEEIYSDLIPQGKADMVISVEPMEALRYLPWLGADGWLITNTKPYVNIPNYPSLGIILSEINVFQNQVSLDADDIAKKLGASRSANMVILGAASPYIDISMDALEDGIRGIFGRKGEEVVKQNIDALHAGRKYAEEHLAV